MTSCAVNEAEGPGPHGGFELVAFLKGAPAVGSDADIVVLEARRCHIVRDSEMHEADYSCWEGCDLATWPSLAMLLGKIVVDGGAFSGDLKDGQFLPRKVAEEVRSGPAL
jgi:dihydropyrimidinase